MITKRTILILLLLCISPSLAAAAIPDGKWNEKPWTQKSLEEGIKKNDKDALAEWAYCSLGTHSGICHDREMIYKRAKLAAKEGSSLGQYLLGICYIQGHSIAKNSKFGIQLIRKAMLAGHPLARWKFQVYERYGLYVKKDTHNALKKMELCLKNGVWQAHGSLAGIYESGQLGVVDYEKAAKHYQQAVTKHRSLQSSLNVFNRAKLKKNGIVSHLPKEVIEQSLARIRTAGRLGDMYSAYLVANHDIHSGSPHLGIPALIAQANAPNAYQFLKTPKGPLRNLCDIMNHGVYSKKEQCYVAIGDVVSSQHAARTCYTAGIRDKAMERLFADAVLKSTFTKKISAAEEKMAIELLRKNIREKKYAHRAHHTLGIYFTGKYDQQNADRKTFDRGMAHQIYHADCPSSAHWICVSYLISKKTRNPAKGVAAAEWAIKQNNGAWRDYEKKWLAAARKKLTPKQKTEAERLIKEGFPYAKKFRLKAFKHLQKVGDIPVGRKFEEIPKPADHDGNIEEAFVPRDLQQLLAIISLLKFMPEASLQPLFTAEENQLMTKYLDQNKLNDKELGKFIGLITKNDTKLKGLLGSHSKGKHAAKVKQLTAILENKSNLTCDDAPLGAIVGWYLIYRGGKVTSSPYICKQLKGSPAAKSGLEIGDVIEKCYGQDMRGTNSRNLFMRLVAFWPANSPMLLEVRSGRYHKEDDDVSIKDVKKKVSVNFVN